MGAKCNSFLLLSILIFFQSGCNNPGEGTGKEYQDSVKLTIMKSYFGKSGNQDVSLYTLTNDNGIVIKITNYGGIITSILMPDKKGKTGDIVLGYDNLNQYIENSPYFGAIVGRYANRIAKGRFTLDGRIYELAINDGDHHLHGGIKGFDKVVWDAIETKDSAQVGLSLSYHSKDGEEGYPGNLEVKVTYALNNNNELRILIEAETDKPTPVNLCNHTYFNLREADTSVLGHMLTLFADKYTPVDEGLIPTGKIAPVSNSAMDFKTGRSVGSQIGQVKGGYDHNYVLQKNPGELSLAAILYDPETGREVKLYTTQPGLQFYSGNFLDGTITGKGGKVYRKHYGLCLETQHFPDSPNQPGFPNAILRPGEKFSEETVFQFTVIK